MPQLGNLRRIHGEVWHTTHEKQDIYTVYSIYFIKLGSSIFEERVDSTVVVCFIQKSALKLGLSYREELQHPVIMGKLACFPSRKVLFRHILIPPVNSIPTELPSAPGMSITE